MIPILMYHQVAELPSKLDPVGLAVSPDQFKQQMSYLSRNGYRCLTLTEAVEHFRRGGGAPTRSFVLTFDDGYQDLLSNACPILEKFGFTATVFLVAGQMGSLTNWAEQDGILSRPLLSWAEARVLAQRGFLLGSHTLSHPRLSLLDDQSAMEEIQNSKVLLQEQLDMQIDLFCYPYFDTDERIEGLVESAGYMAACAGNSGPWSIFHLWRVPCLRNDTMRTFTLKVSGWYEKRTALRESAPGLLLRRTVRRLRHRPVIHSRPAALNSVSDSVLRENDD